MPGQQLRQLHDHLGMPAEGQTAIGPPLMHGKTQLLQSGRPGRDDFGIQELRERRPVPAPQRLTVQLLRARCLTLSQGLLRLEGQPFEPRGVQRITRHHAIAVALPFDALRAQGLAQ